MFIQPKVVKPGAPVPTFFERLFCGWEFSVRIALGFSIVLIGVGRIESAFSAALSVSAWSVSRTTFFFWLIGRLVFAWRGGRAWNMKRSEALPFGLFLAAILLSLVPRFHDLSDFRYLCFALAHALMVLDMFRDRPGRRFLVLALGLTPAFLLLRGLYENPLVFEFTLNYRLGHPLDHPNTAGHLLAMSLPLAAALLLIECGRRRLVVAVAAVAQLAALLLTYSRGAWLGFGAALAFLFAALGTRKEFFLLLLFLVIPLLSVEPLRQRMLGVFDAGSDQAISDRMVRMRDTLRVGVANPVLGVGYGRGRLKAAIRAHPASETSVNEPIWHGHNLYLELFAGTGLIGLGAYLLLLVKAFASGWRALGQAASNDRILTLGLMASGVAMLLCGLSDVTFHHHETRLFGFTLMALLLLAQSEGQSLAARSREFPTG